MRRLLRRGRWLVVAGALPLACIGPITPDVEWVVHAVESFNLLNPAVIAAADMDRDGDLDAIVGLPGAPDEGVEARVVLLIRQDNDDWDAYVIAQGALVTGVSALAIGDVDLDGRLDVAAACGERLVYLNAPVDPTMTTRWLVSEIAESVLPEIVSWSDVAIGDIDGRNSLDVVATCDDPGRLSVFRSPLNADTGAGWERVDVATTGQAGAASLALRDLDADTDLDILTAAPDEPDVTVAWFEHPGGRATAAFEKHEIGRAVGATYLAAGDLDADGLTDVVVSCPDDTRVVWYRHPGRATGRWDDYELIDYTRSVPTYLAIANVDNAGLLDVIVASHTSDQLLWFSAGTDATRTWATNALYTASERIGRFAVGDVDLDGRPDVVIPLDSDLGARDRVEWLENPF